MLKFFNNLIILSLKNLPYLTSRLCPIRYINLFNNKFKLIKKSSSFKSYRKFSRVKTIKFNKFFLNLETLNNLKLNIHYFYLLNKNNNFINIYYVFIWIRKISIFFKIKSIIVLNIFKSIFGNGYIYLRNLLIIFSIDACCTDDEPLWEPIEWSLVLTWILFIFILSWIAENLITSRYGSYTGRDKRVWFGWYKTFWLLEVWFALSYATAALMVITPFYSELTYSISFSVSWWNWYNRLFFFKFISLYSIIILIAFYFQINLRWLNWKKLSFFVVLINLFLSYLIYTHFIMTFFGYFTDPLWYQKSRYIDYIQLSHEPWKWGWGPAKRDHFSYHKVSTDFWFKSDGPYAGAFLLIQTFIFLSLFLLYIYWLVLLRRVFSTYELSITYSTYCISALKQFLILFLMVYFFVIISFIGNYWRFPIEFIWTSNSSSWGWHLLLIICDYFELLIKILLGFVIY